MRNQLERRIGEKVVVAVKGSNPLIPLPVIIREVHEDYFLAEGDRHTMFFNEMVMLPYSAITLVAWQK